MQTVPLNNEEEEEEDILKPVQRNAANTPSPPPPVSSSARTIEARNQQIESKTFWAEHEQWARSIERILLISIDEPIQMSRTLTNPNPPFTYLIKTSLNSLEGVRRRYSDFELVRSQLAVRYPGVLQLPLPDKSPMNKNTEAFLFERAKGLRLYVEHALTNDFFQHDVMFRNFLLMPTGEWEQAKKNLWVDTVATQQQQQPQQTVSDRFRNAVLMTQLPLHCDEVVTKQYDSIVRLESILRAMHQGSIKVAQASRAYATSISELHRQVLLAASTASPINIPLEQWRDGAQIDSVVVEEWLVESVLRQLEMVTAMRMLMDQRKQLSSQADVKLAVLHKFEVEVETNLKRGIQIVTAQQKVHDAMKQLKDANFQVEYFTRALFLNGMSTFVEERARAIQLLLASFATAQLRKDERAMRDVWFSFLSTFRLEVQELEGKTLRTVQQKLPEKFKQVFE